MQGLSEKTKLLFESISNLDCIKDYILIGGTALSLQITHRLSEDLDFCKWPYPQKSEVDWPKIRMELETFCKSVKPDVLDFNQVNFLADGVKLSFYSNQLYKSPVSNSIIVQNKVKVADIETIGAMKLEVMLRRSNFRDYYDLYSILKEGKSLKSLVDNAIKYSNNILKSKSILNFISNGDNFKKDDAFELLEPKYPVNSKDIETYIKLEIKKDYPIEIPNIIDKEQKRGQGLSM